MPEVPKVAWGRGAEMTGQTSVSASPLRWLVATGNPGKLRELQAMLAPRGVEVVSQKALGIADAGEPWPSFVGNALAKARHGARESGLPALADDSGLCVPALGGAPGIRSARFALDLIDDPARRAALQAGGREALDAENIVQLLAQCAPLRAPGQPVRAYFCSVLVWVASADDPRPLIAEGIWWGTLLPAPQGEGGFGYDPVFQPDGFSCSAAQLALQEKNAISHRHRAMVRLQALLDEAAAGGQAAAGGLPVAGGSGSGPVAAGEAGGAGAGQTAMRASGLPGTPPSASPSHGS